jgi:hypothetical protein
VSLAKWTPLEEALANRFLGEAVPVPFLCQDENGDVLWPAGKKITRRAIRILAENMDRVWIIPSPMSRILREIRDKFPVHFRMECEQGSCCGGEPCGRVFMAREGLDAVCPDCGTRYHACPSDLS